MKKVVLLEALGIPQAELEALQRPFENEVEFAAYPRTADVEQLKAEVKDADALILANMPLPGEVIRAAKRLQFIDVAFTGVDHVALDVAREQGIRVSNASGYSNEAVAELVIAMVLSMLRKLRQVEDRARAGGVKDGLVGGELRGRTVGIIGYGRIGSRTGELMHAFGCHVLAQRRGEHQRVPEFVELVSQEELLRRSDIVVLHCPLNDSTRGMINAEKLALMRPTALLINVARGPVVDEAALAEALREGRIGGACVPAFQLLIVRTEGKADHVPFPFSVEELAVFPDEIGGTVLIFCPGHPFCRFAFVEPAYGDPVFVNAQIIKNGRP